ncbi:MAG: M23 family metallopeptidase [Dissulfurimicrobium hydrothermale]|uniref:M23 family metallopeptidase n=1 Tax=Dissulfurimicrobium hydrothermale TaxID=1750598 RepID=UPI003C7622E1
MGKFLIYFSCAVLAAILLAGTIVSTMMLKGPPPEINAISAPRVIGREAVISFRFHDSGRGIREITASIIQGKKVVTLESKRFPVISWWKGTSIKDKIVSWQVAPLAMGLHQGKAILRATARDASWRNDFNGNETTFQSEVVIDVTPPSITVLSTIHNMISGGAGLVSYKVNKDISRTGVWVDDIFFPAYPRPQGSAGEYSALIAIPFDVPRPKLYIEAVDTAGNVAKTGFPYQIHYMAPKVDRINISDNFLEQKMPEFTARYPDLTGTPLNIFLQVNSKLRTENDQEIKNICLKSSPKIMWQGAFIRPPGAKRAGFADERHYFYNGKEISQAHHMGVDIAALAHFPVRAGNSGKVIFTGYLGIYGNAIIIDHGFGLASLYGHLESINTAVGARVERGTIIGTTDSTGLSGGDHLHYAMMVHGVFINPTEWWDDKWIKDHIINNLLAK